MDILEFQQFGCWLSQIIASSSCEWDILEKFEEEMGKSLKKYVFDEINRRISPWKTRDN